MPAWIRLLGVILSPNRARRSHQRLLRDVAKLRATDERLKALIERFRKLATEERHG
jgi:hypothetical protein